jgi:hypothetical protein
MLESSMDVLKRLELFPDGDEALDLLEPIQDEMDVRDRRRRRRGHTLRGNKVLSAWGKLESRERV